MTDNDMHDITFYLRGKVIRRVNSLDGEAVLSSDVFKGLSKGELGPSFPAIIDIGKLKPEINSKPMSFSFTGAIHKLDTPILNRYFKSVSIPYDTYQYIQLSKGKIKSTK